MIVTALPTSEFKDQPFEYVIVGSGAGGAPLAAGLADLGHTVLVLEAGPDHTNLDKKNPIREVSAVPALHGPSTERPELSWRFWVDHYAAPADPDPKAGPDGKIFYPRATGIGGCTIHNAMITVAGPAADWDQLSWVVGDSSWSADAMRGYFRRLERCQYYPRPTRPTRPWRRLVDAARWLFGYDDDPSAGRHGFDGWLRTSFPDLTIGLRDAQLLKMLKAAAVTSAEAGMEAPFGLASRALHGQVNEGLDPNHFRRQRQRPEGAVLIPTAINGEPEQANRGHRSSAAARLLEASDRHGDRLVIATDCLATRVILQTAADGTVRATGVEYVHGRALYAAVPKNDGKGQPGGVAGTVMASREVVLCGGAFNTPQLLMLSGIGPAAHLAEHKVKCQVDSPGVGLNLHDRYEVTVVSKMRHKFELLKEATFKLPDPPEAAADAPLAQWRKDGTGLYASNGAVIGLLKRSSPELAQPDLFIFGIPLTFRGYQVGYSKVDRDKFDLFTWAILKAHTRNRGGTVRLTSADPTATPAINFNYFGTGQTDDAGRPVPPPADDPDLDAVLAGVKFVRRIAAEAGAEEDYPGRDVDTDDAVRRWVRQVAWGHHACGTCRMGRDIDPLAVIDCRFRVLAGVDPDHPRQPRGRVGGLRVVDASIFPDIPGYFIVTNVYMASEKAADVIHADAVAASPAARRLRWPAKPTGGPPAAVATPKPIRTAAVGGPDENWKQTPAAEVDGTGPDSSYLPSKTDPVAAAKSGPP